MTNRSFHKIIHSPMLWLTVALIMVLALGFPHAASADPPENSQELHLGETANAVIVTPGEIVYFSFTPEETDTYIFSGESGTSVQVYLTVGNSTTSIYNSTARELTAGTTYYFGIRFWSSSETGTIPVTINLTPILNWEVDENDVLTISGRGAMKDYYWDEHPWSNTIKKVIIGDRITSIGNYAFYDCRSLTSIEIPEGVTRIGKYAFDCCVSLTSIEIPEEVASIGEWAFCNCNLTSIEIPEGVTSIGDGTFSGCDSLTSIEIPEGVTNIGNYAFRGCSSLTSIEIPEGVTNIGNEAFRGCSSLTSIEIPEGVTSIGYYTFYDCNSLTSIEIPEGVISIGDFAFSDCKNLTSIEIPEGVTSIGEYAFYDCSSLTSIEIPEGVTSIGVLAFYGCSSLTSIKIPEGVTSIGYYTFHGCSSLTSIEIPEGVTSIGHYAFEGCNSLTSIEIPEGVTSIGERTFSGCSSLTSIEIPERVTSIGSHAFSGCNSLISIEIPDGVTSIGEWTFYSCSSLTSIEIPEGVTSIGNYAFDGCSSLTSIDIPEGITSIGASAFDGCSSLTSIEIPEGVTSINDYTFSRCSSLTGIEIPEGITSIGISAFMDCSSLTNIVIPEGVTSINDCTFSGCSSLTGIEIPEGVTSIGNNTFSNCSSLTSIEIPEGVTSIGKWAFYGCNSLTSIEIPDGVTSIGNYTFYGCDGLTSIEIPEGVTNIGDFAFSSCKNLISIEIPDNVTSIGNSAFSDCDSLTSITIPEGITSISNNAFSDCNKLGKICFLGMNTEIGDIPVDGLPTVYCYQNSTAKAWADDQELPVVLLNGQDPADLLTVSLPQTMKVSIGRRTPIPASIFYTSPINSISWVSSNENILTVDDKGVITPVHTGTARVTLTVDGKSASTVITVFPLATELLAPDETLYAIMNRYNHFIIQTEPRNAMIDPVCEFADPSYGHIYYTRDEDYEKLVFGVYPEKVGTTSLIIRDRYSGITKTVPFKITRSMPQSIEFEKKEVLIGVGQTAQLNTVITLANGTQIRNYNAEFWVSEGGSVNVDRYSGKVTGIKPGKTVIYCETSGENDKWLDASCTVTVTKGTEIIIPKNLVEILPESFAGTDAMIYIIQPGGSTTTIRNRAFADLACDAVSVHIPSSVTIIEDKAFEGCVSVTIFGKPGSEAETHANSHDNCSFVEE